MNPRLPLALAILCAGSSAQAGQLPSIPTWTTDFSPCQTTKLARICTNPSWQTTFPSRQTTLPGWQTTLPGWRTTFPSWQTTLPDRRTTFPSWRTTNPAWISTNPSGLSIHSSLLSSFSGKKTAIQSRPTPLPPHAEDNVDLAALDAKVAGLLKEGKYQDLTRLAPENRATILKMVEEDRLGTLTDFLRASTLYDDPQGWFETRRAQHEFALQALAMMQSQPNDALKRTWDFLMVSMGRRQRFGFIKSNPQVDPTGRYLPDSVPLAIKRIFDDPVAAKKAALAATDNEEIKKLRTEDQAIRTGQITQAMMERMAKEDPIRQKRVMELLQSGVPRTAGDFEALALIMQHGGEFEDYRLAHELIMAAMLIGYKSPWLLAATYDRMMLSVGHRQRYGTQWWQSGMAPLDDLAINDRMRLQMGVPKLADLRANEKEVIKRFFGG